MSNIIIAPPNIRELHLQVTGKSGLICHHFGQKSRKQIEDTQAKVAKGPKEARDPKAEYEGAFYKLENGGYGFPCAGVQEIRYSCRQATRRREYDRCAADVLC